LYRVEELCTDFIRSEGISLEEFTILLQKASQEVQRSKIFSREEKKGDILFDGVSEEFIRTVESMSNLDVFSEMMKCVKAGDSLLF
jgi:hypothetical protein